MRPACDTADEVALAWLLPILERRAASHKVSLAGGDTEPMTRRIDQGYEARHRATPPMLVADVRAGLANGSMVRGTAPRTASGRGMTPVQGDILLAHQVSAVVPALARSQTAVAWEVIEPPAADEAGWRAVVVGIRAG